MRVLRSVAWGVFVFAFCLTAHAQSSTNSATTVLGQWDFNSADLTLPTTGAALRFLGGLQGIFETNQINGRPAGVMRLPGPVPQEQALLAPFTHLANGGGTNLNQYSLVMDVMWPAESALLFRAIFNSSTNNEDDAEIFVNPDDQIGVNNNYALNVPITEWHRIALVYDLANPTNSMIRYVDGNTNNAAPQLLEGGNVDGRFSLRGGLLLFSDEDGENPTVFVNSIQLRAGAMTPEQVAALGPASSGGIGQGPDPVGEIRISSIQRSGNNVVIQLSEGRNAQLQKTVRLDTPSWQPLETSSAGTFTVPIVEPTAFFRVELR
jgi:hypothetical protein